MQKPFQSLTDQVAASIRQQIRSGQMQVLPSERELALQLQISRPTIRKALAILRTEGCIRTEGRRTYAQSSHQTATPPRRQRKISILLPDPFVQALPNAMLWIHSLSNLLYGNGHKLELVNGQRYYGERSSRSLANLVKTSRADCWVLTRTTRALQRWFSEQKVPAVVAGSVYPSISLPSVDIDHTAFGRHAAAAFLRNGHTRVALFFEKLWHAGDMETEAGFKTEFSRHSDTEQPIISHIERTPNATVQELRRLLSLQSPPSGFLFCDGFSYLTAQTYMNSLGYLIPRDISMISEDEGPFLSHMLPEPTRYTTNAEKFAKAMSRAITQVLKNQAPGDFKIRIMPEFIRGASLGPMKEVTPLRQKATLL